MPQRGTVRPGGHCLFQGRAAGEEEEAGASGTGAESGGGGGGSGRETGWGCWLWWEVGFVKVV